MANAHFHALLQRNRTVYDRPLSQLADILKATRQAKIRLEAALAAKKASIKRAKEFIERCDSLLKEI